MRTSWLPRRKKDCVVALYGNDMTIESSESSWFLVWGTQREKKKKVECLDVYMRAGWKMKKPEERFVRHAYVGALH